MEAHGWRATLPVARTVLAGASGHGVLLRIQQERLQTGQCVKLAIHGSTAGSSLAVISVCSLRQNVPFQEKLPSGSMFSSESGCCWKDCDNGWLVGFFFLLLFCCDCLFFSVLIQQDVNSTHRYLNNEKWQFCSCTYYSKYLQTSAKKWLHFLSVCCQTEEKTQVRLHRSPE